MDARLVGSVGLLTKLVPIALPEHPQVDEVRQVLLESSSVQRGQIEGFGFIPQLVEPTDDLADHVGVVVPEVQLDVGRQPCVGEVRRASDHTLVVGGDHERLAMKKAVLKAADLHVIGFQPRH
jgi:hypothetical protein